MSGKKGFTLIELIVVIAIIAVLAAIIAPNAFKAVEKAKISKAISDFKTIKTATYALYSDTGKWVRGGNSSLMVHNSDLLNNVSGWAGWDGSYLDKFRGAHPWGGTYFFTNNAQLGGGAAYELSVEFEDYRFPSGPNGDKPIPAAAARKIDAMVDDGNLGTGGFRGGGDYHWALIWDVCPHYACQGDPL